ncbi:hypothetical protein GDO78_012686 [Eleutherodactylus coqui]|uniref:Uncharacterized protein n=1 Tax=Eleutherodactylus coqui TaxID=57060 RepID=A0A8J6K337_ELECQ|nr:hypothetical protein GDO78_012686 [Eleutherodactylus coqui]
MRMTMKMMLMKRSRVTKREVALRQMKWQPQLKRSSMTSYNTSANRETLGTFVIAHVTELNCCVATSVSMSVCFVLFSSVSLDNSIFVYFAGDTTCFTHFEIVILRVFYIRNCFIFSKAKENEY